MTVEQIIRTYTMNGAYLLHAENETGSIEVGKSADMVVISQNLFEIEPMEIYNTVPLKTIYRGSVVYER